ncbi:MAG: hypothetical protein IAE65_04975 [Ignavibacteria bacterium]|nr:hypothetical protein [Ignavibacteria bacterium]HCN36764.1 hypothetical protein [Bacteroidota bacterium]
MSDLQSKLDLIKSKESFLEKIKRYIPGYDGYVNRDNARELDTQLRNKLALSLEANKTSLKNALNSLTKNKKLFESQDLDKLDKKNENVIAKLKSASRGYSGAFDIVKIKEEKLNQIYEFDNALISDIEIINNSFNEIESNASANTDIKTPVENASRALDNLISKFDQRELILKELN